MLPHEVPRRKPRALHQSSGLADERLFEPEVSEEQSDLLQLFPQLNTPSLPENLKNLFISCAEERGRYVFR